MAEQEQAIGSQVGLLMRQPARDHEQEAPGTQPAGQVQRDPLALASCRVGSAGCAAEQASTLKRATDNQPARARGSLLRLQREYGNRFVRRVVNLSRKGQGEGDVAPEVEQAIQIARGGGQALDSTVRAQMEPALGADFSGVRVHTGGQADTLNRNLSARAFTTGQDIFFKQGEYSPGSSGGRELLAHELTHVVQQNGNQVQTKLTVGAPGDRYEQEADSVARAVLQQEQQPKQQQTAQRQTLPEEEEKKKEPMQAKRDEGQVQRQAEEEKKEEEPVQTKLQDGQVKRQAEEEDEREPADIQGTIQRQETSNPPEMEEKLKEAAGTQRTEDMASQGGRMVLMRKDIHIVQPTSLHQMLIQRRGGATLGELSVNSNVVNQGLTDGHAWLAYTPVGGTMTTYGTWGNRQPIGLHRDLELGQAPAATRKTDLDSADYSALTSFAAANNAWGYLNNCASFAGRGWETVTGEALSYTTFFIPNPSALGGGIVAGNGGTTGVLPNAPATQPSSSSSGS